MLLKHTPTRRFRWFSLPSKLFSLSLSLLAGCASVGPDFVRPAVLMPEAAFATPAGAALASQLLADAPDADWWARFEDATLNELQLLARQSNLDLQVAETRIAQSRAQFGLAGVVGLPRLGLAGSYAREAISGNGPMARLGAPDTAHDMWQTGFDVSWEIDLWGYARRMRESGAASLKASQFAAEGVRVSLAAEVARNYVLLRNVQAQQEIAQQNRSLAEHVLRLTQQRASQGVATRFEVAAAAAQRASIDALLPKLAQQLSVLKNALSLLLGKPPHALDSLLNSVQAVPRVPSKVPVGLPSAWARRRPDILQAEAVLHAATANIGVAKADFYPRIRLNGGLGFQAFEAQDLSLWSSRNFSIGPALYLPIFDGGRLTSTLKLTEARAQEAAIAYQQTVLRAWHEVDNALNLYAAEQWQHEQLTQAFTFSQQAHHAALRRYEEGAANYLTVLTAERTLRSNERELADSKAALSLALVGLYKALGGGWSGEAEDADADNTKSAS